MNAPLGGLGVNLPILTKRDADLVLPVATFLVCESRESKHTPIALQARTRVGVCPAGGILAAIAFCRPSFGIRCWI
ncbi:hypothetical protein [uncultured Thermosynechococcus sp.]|uniref:hypothetical protein n=1 Tax=uncultured Thermosynechococcus sp. TaxID=436945 RepID=UPI00261876EA|nr:hypothetical protein [uncultured Thermosynechococcus sp.]